MTRKTVATTILALWLIALGWLGYRQMHRSELERLADAALKVSPAGYYYKVYQGGREAGFASSTIDTLHGALQAVDVFRGRVEMEGDTQVVRVTATQYFAHRLVLDSLTIATTGIPIIMGGRTIVPRGDSQPFTVHANPKVAGSSVFLPSFMPVPFMLMNAPAPGRTAHFSMYNPITREVQPGTLQIRAESLFTVSDSARYDSTAHGWTSAHQDTVRAWSVAPASSGFIAWVDRQGRLVAAMGPHGLRLIRSSFEEASEHWHQL